MKGTSGSQLNPDKINSIEPGVTGIAEILEWLGPPDLIIDGTKKIFDQENAGSVMYGSISTRTLTAPEGMVILVYFLRSEYTTTLRGVSVGYTAIQVQEVIRPNELFIYLSKKDKTVVSLVSGNRSK